MTRRLQLMRLSTGPMRCVTAVTMGVCVCVCMCVYTEQAGGVLGMHLRCLTDTTDQDGPKACMNGERYQSSVLGILLHTHPPFPQAKKLSDEVEAAQKRAKKAEEEAEKERARLAKAEELAGQVGELGWFRWSVSSRYLSGRAGPRGTNQDESTREGPPAKRECTCPASHLHSTSSASFGVTASSDSASLGLLVAALVP